RGRRGRARPPARQERRGRGRGVPGADVVGTRGGVVVTVSSTLYLAVAAGLFTIGAFGFLVRRNVLVMFMCVELMLNAVNLTFVTFARMLDDIGGQALVFFVLVVAAAEVVVGLGIIVSIFRRRVGATADDLHILAGFVLLVLFGRKLADPLAGWVATLAIGSSFVATAVTFAYLLGRDAEHRA